MRDRAEQLPAVVRPKEEGSGFSTGLVLGARPVLLDPRITAGSTAVLLGNGDGTFDAQEISPVAHAHSMLVAGDFDGDGRLDLAITPSPDGGPGAVSVLLGNGDGTFQTEEHFLAGVQPTSIVAADLDGDGRLDLATTNGKPGCGSGGACGAGSDDVTVLLNLPPSTECPARFHRGDPNTSGTTDISDGISIFGFLFLGNPATLSCKESADTNNDGTIDISDGINLLNWLFLGGTEPAPPGPTEAPCGLDPDPADSPGDLGCVEYPPCP